MPRTRPFDTEFTRFHLDFDPLRKRRRLLDLTQRQLAAAAGVHVATVHRMERNRTEPTLRQMIAISRALGVPVHHLYDVAPLVIEESA